MDFKEYADTGRREEGELLMIPQEARSSNKQVSGCDGNDTRASR